MEIYERIRYLRKDCLKYSQDKFGAVLGVKRDVIKNIELNLLARPEQKEPLIKLICKTFNVSYEWITTGEGDVYVQTKQSFVEKLAAEYGLSFTAQKIVECYMNLDDEQRATVDYFITSVAESIVEAAAEGEDAPPLSVVDSTIEKIETYQAAQSKTGKEHGIVTESQSEIDRLKKIPRVTSADELSG